MTTFILLTITGLGLGAMYFLIASGLSLIYGLMGVLNFAHGVFITVGSYATWWMSENVFDGVHNAWLRFLVSALCGLAAGAVFAALVELILIRPLYQRHIEQVLVTVGLSIAFVALVQGIWGPDVHPYTVPGWMHDTTTVLGAHIPNDRWVEIAAAAVVLVGLQLFLRRTTPRFCSTSSTVVSSDSRSSTCATSATSAGASPLVGSSTRSRRFSFRSARAIASICCWPPESVPARWLPRLSSSGNKS